MKLELKDFQEDAVESMLKRLRQAKREILEDGDPQAVILSSPTGSGKTVISTAMIEEILEGSDRVEAEPNAVFLWLSDQPELNQQSRQKMTSTSTRLHKDNLVIVDTDFDQEIFTGGNVYFLNIQKLSKSGILTSGNGDKRNFTIWETIANTAARLKDKFYLIIDEAHRGTRPTRNDLANQKTIVQKFILGHEGEIPPINLILGVSATPQRFQQLLQQQTKRMPRVCEISPDDVRSSGLLKDQIILFHPEDNQSVDWTLLAEAASHWMRTRDAWNTYTNEQGQPPVYPAMVIQVEDGDGRSLLSRTDMSEVIRVLESVIGPIKDEELAHSFEQDQTVEAGGKSVRKINASQIQEETGVKFIFFKMALTTGWDCPRAEVMMSFRRAQDDTLIAQLIGRMIRNPLARRIEGREELNTVALYLPHYDKDGLNRVVNYLKSDPEAVPPTDIEEGAKMVTFKRDENAIDSFKALTGLPTYRVENVRKVSNVRRMMRLSRLLTMLHEIDNEAWTLSQKLVINTLDDQLAKLREDDASFETKIAAFDEISVNAVTVEQGTWKELPSQTVKVKLNDNNIDDMFNRIGQRLGEGLHLDYWKAHYDKEYPNRAKLELFLVMQSEKTWDALEKAAGERISALFSSNKAAIRKLSSSQREEYNKIQEVAKDPEALDFLPPTEIMVSIDPDDDTVREYKKHLFIESIKGFLMKSTDWERITIEAEISRADVVGWLRNYERKPWALAMPYDYQGEIKPMYPDFLIVRQRDDELIVDILEPHSSHLADNYAKAKGLARFAAKHSNLFGRIELIRVEGNEIKRLDLANATTRQQVLLVGNNQGLDLIFGIQ